MFILDIQPIVLKILSSNNVISEQIIKVVFDFNEIKLNSMQKSCSFNVSCVSSNFKN